MMGMESERKGRPGGFPAADLVIMRLGDWDLEEVWRWRCGSTDSPVFPYEEWPLS